MLRRTLRLWRRVCSAGGAIFALHSGQPGRFGDWLAYSRYASQYINNGAAGLRSSWPAGGRARHISVKQYFLRDLKEAGILRIAHRAGELAASGIFTKSTPKDIFERHGSKLYGEGKYYKEFAAPKLKKGAAALAKAGAWKGIAENALPPLKSEKAPKSFAASKRKKKGRRKPKVAPARESA